MKILMASLTTLFVLSNTLPTLSCTLADTRKNFSKFNEALLSYQRFIAAHKDRAAIMPAPAPTPPDDKPQQNKDETALQPADIEARTQLAPSQKLTRLQAKLADLTAELTAIRKLFATEIQNKPKMKADDQVNPQICARFAAMASKHKIIITQTPTSQEKPAVCTKRDLMPRFGAATRLQRKLTLAGKVSRRERVNYLKIVTEFNKKRKHDFTRACQILDRYEKRLRAEK